LVSVWKRNDFGEWAFAIFQDKVKMGYFIHTTPDDEISRRSGAVSSLSFSHGCIHMFPDDRNDAKNKGYLKKGFSLKVLGFDAKGPPV
jgi:lipoprotein-anchoring transpeptidase ErfK/SrfK